MGHERKKEKDRIEIARWKISHWGRLVEKSQKYKGMKQEVNTRAYPQLMREKLLKIIMTSSIWTQKERAAGTLRTARERRQKWEEELKRLEKLDGGKCSEVPSFRARARPSRAILHAIHPHSPDLVAVPPFSPSPRLHLAHPAWSRGKLKFGRS